MKNLFKLRLKTITPIHIFSGDYFYDYEFFIKDKKIYLVNFDKILKNTYLKNYFYILIDKFFLDGKYDFKKELDNFYLVNFDYLKEKNLVYSEIDLDLTEDEIQRLQTNRIYKFITYYDIKKEKEEIYIPGSSLKGSFFDILKRYLGDDYDDSLRKKIGFSDFYFFNKNNWIQKIVRIKYKDKKIKEGNKLMIELAEGEAYGEVFFEEKLTDILKRLFYEGGTLIKKKRKFNVEYSCLFSDQLMKNIEESEILMILLGFGSLSYESNRYRYPSSYYSYNLKDPLGIVSLEIIDK